MTTSPPPDPVAPLALSDAESRRLFLTVFPSVTMAMFLSLLDQTIVTTALPAIVSDLGRPEAASGVVIWYLVAATVAAPVYGRLGDLLGRRRLLLVALVIFLVAAVFCAFAHDMTLLTIGRALQGIGGGGLMTLSQALVGESVPPRVRARYQGYLAATGVSANTFGPVMGGLLSEYFGWQSIFVAVVILGIGAGLLALRLPDRPGTGGTFRFDYLGLMFLSALVGSVLLLLQQAQQPGALDLTLVSILAPAALLSLVALLITEKRASTPIIPIPLLRIPAIWRTDALTACYGGMLISLLAFTPIYLRVMHGISPAETGMLLVPMTIGLGISSLTTGRIISATGYTAIIPSIGLVVAALGLAGIAFASPHVDSTTFAALLWVTALTFGTVMPVVQVTVQETAGPAFLGAGSATVQFARSLGGAFGTALVAAVLFLALSFTEGGAAALFDSMLRQGPELFDAMGESARAGVRAQLADAFRNTFLVIAALPALGALCAWSIPLRRL